MIAAGNFFGILGQRSAWEISSAEAIDRIMDEGFLEAPAALWEANKEAWEDPDFWMGHLAGMGAGEALPELTAAGTSLLRKVLRISRAGVAAAGIAMLEEAPTAFAIRESRGLTTMTMVHEGEDLVRTGNTASTVARRTEISEQVGQVAKKLTPATQQATQAAQASASTASTTSAISQTVASTASTQQPIMNRAQYLQALGHVFPSQYFDPVMRVVEQIGQSAAQAAVANPRFVDACRNGNWTLAGTFFHSAAARVGPTFASQLPPGFTMTFEDTIQTGKGGSRFDIRVKGPGVDDEIDWKTTGRSALSTGARSEMAKHAAQYSTNQGASLTSQVSKSWVDFVRPLLPGINWTR